MFKNILYDLEQSFDGNITQQIQTNIKKVVFFLLCNSPASGFYMPTFRNTLSGPSS